MAKSAKHKKIRKQEKAKTQLTGVKKLSKGLNVFDPKLQTKKIVIREQLKLAQQTSEITTKKKQNLNEILTSLNHPNANIRKESLKGLNEILVASSNNLNIEKVLQKLLLLASDEDSSVRAENLKVFQYFFAQINENQIKPFWPLVLTHLKCTLTNLNIKIRYNALPYISLIISHFPGLVLTTLRTLLPNLLDLISFKSDSSSAKPGIAKLKNEVSGKQGDALKERIRVFGLIEACLSLRDKNDVQDFRPEVVTYNWSEIGQQENRVKEINLYKNLYRTNVFNRKQSKEFMKGSLDSANVPKNENFWFEFSNTCFTLLNETWIEVGPSMEEKRIAGLGHFGTKKDTKRNHDRSALNTNVLEILHCFVKIMTFLIKDKNADSNSNDTDSVETQQFGANIGAKLKKCFLSFLPFSTLSDSDRNTARLVNLNLFNIASQLSLFSDKKLVHSFKTYLKGIKEEDINAEEANLILYILGSFNQEEFAHLLSEFVLLFLQSNPNVALSFLLNLTSLKNQEGKTPSLLMALSWDLIVPELFSLEILSTEVLTLLTFISIRKLTNIRPQLEAHISTFQNVLKSEDLSKSAEVERLFIYSDSELLLREIR